ncbi:MAG: hypothetical protein KQ78_01318 [Candidatus Izimaplasma bacterium HR2]|nr:MAG: hypothetical protein KQ78_01318 [Candidatus Izimaplasma bacterium HR2]
MNRENYYNKIDELLAILAHRIRTNNRLNLTSKNIHMENFLVHFYNELFDLAIVNANFLSQNTKAIDLIDDKNKKIYQVSSTCTKKKLQDSLDNVDNKYVGYEFYFSPIAKADANHLKRHKYNTKAGIIFNKNSNILDYTKIMNHIISLDIRKLIIIHNLVELELGNILSFNINNMGSYTSEIILLLSKEPLVINDNDAMFNTTEFEIDKKIDFNVLSNATKRIIDEFKYFGNRINNKYLELEKQGNNIRYSILFLFQKTYLKLMDSCENPDDLFTKITESIVEKLYLINPNLAIEDLDLYVTILTVDAFIRCKIFENPNKIGDDASVNA